MGRTYESSNVGATANRSFKKINRPSTEVADLILDNEFNIELVLRQGASPVVSLDLLDDFEKTAAFSKNLLKEGYSTPNSLFVTRSDLDGIFLLGGDLALFRYYIEKQDLEGLKRYGRKAVRAIWSLINGLHSRRLTVSYVNGEAQGGGFECALGSNVLIATKRATFGFPESLFGLFPGMGASQLLRARADSYAAKTLLAKSSRYPAEMLAEMGIIDYLIEDGELPDLLTDLKRGLSDEDSLDHFTTRFRSVSYEDLVDTVDDWVYQALRLDRRKIDVMGIILKAQSRLLQRKPNPTIAKPSEAACLADFELHQINRSVGKGPIVLRPKSATDVNARRALNFLKENSSWIDRNLEEHGAILLQDFPGTGSQWMKSVLATLGGAQPDSFIDRIENRKAVRPGIYNFDQSVECPTFSAGTFPYPPSKTILYRDLQPTSGGGIRYADSRKILEAIPSKILGFFEGQGVRYSWKLRTERRHKEQGTISWQYLFGTTDKAKVAKECFERGLFYRWLEPDNGLEVWIDSQPISFHPNSGDRIWRNSIHDFVNDKTSAEFPGINRVVTLEDGSTIPDSIIREIREVILEQSCLLRWEEGDIIILDSHLASYTCEPAVGLCKTLISHK